MSKSRDDRIFEFNMAQVNILVRMARTSDINRAENIARARTLLLEAQEIVEPCPLPVTTLGSSQPPAKKG